MFVLLGKSLLQLDCMQIFSVGVVVRRGSKVLSTEFAGPACVASFYMALCFVNGQGALDFEGFVTFVAGEGSLGGVSGDDVVF